MMERAMTRTNPAAPPVCVDSPAVHRAAQKMRAFRRERNWTQEAMAAKFGVSRQQVARWEVGMMTPRRAAMEALEREGVCAPADWFLPPVPETA